MSHIPLAGEGVGGAGDVQIARKSRVRSGELNCAGTRQLGGDIHGPGAGAWTDLDQLQAVKVCLGVGTQVRAAGVGRRIGGIGKIDGPARPDHDILEHHIIIALNELIETIRCIVSAIGDRRRQIAGHPENRPTVMVCPITAVASINIQRIGSGRDIV